MDKNFKSLRDLADRRGEPREEAGPVSHGGGAQALRERAKGEIAGCADHTCGSCGEAMDRTDGSTNATKETKSTNWALAFVFCRELFWGSGTSFFS